MLKLKFVLKVPFPVILSTTYLFKFLKSYNLPAPSINVQSFTHSVPSADGINPWPQASQFSFPHRLADLMIVLWGQVAQVVVLRSM